MGGGDVEWVMQLATNAVRGLLCLWNKDYFILNTSCVGDGWFRGQWFKGLWVMFRVQWFKGLWVMFRLEWFKGLGFGLRVYGLGLEFRGLRFQGLWVQGFMGYVQSFVD